MNNAASLGWPLRTWWIGSLVGFHTKRLRPTAMVPSIVNVRCSGKLSTRLLFESGSSAVPSISVSWKSHPEQLQPCRLPVPSHPSCPCAGRAGSPQARAAAGRVAWGGRTRARARVGLREKWLYFSYTLTLWLSLGAALLVTKGHGAPEVEHAYTQARALCQQMGDTPELVPVLFGLWRYYIAQPQLHTAREIGDTLPRLAQRAHAPAFTVMAHQALGFTSFCLGVLSTARM